MIFQLLEDEKQHLLKPADLLFVSNNCKINLIICKKCDRSHKDRYIYQDIFGLGDNNLLLDDMSLWAFLQYR